MAQFDKIDAPWQFKDEWSKYPHGYTIYEALLNWVAQVNDMVVNVNDWNTYLEGFVSQFDENLKQQVTETVQQWIDNGYIEVVITEALQTQIDTVEGNLNTFITETEGDLTVINDRLDLLGTKMGVNVKDYGALGNGSANDTTAFTSALADVPVGGYLIIPDGTYMIGSMVIDKAMQVIGYGRATVKANASGTNFVDVRASDVTITGLTVDGNDLTMRGVFILHTCSRVTIQRCTIKNMYNADQNMECAGVFVQGNNEHIHVLDCVISRIRSLPNGVQGDNLGSSRGVTFNPFGQDEPTRNSSVKNCLIEGISPQEDGDGVSISQNATTTNVNISIVGNTFKDCHKRFVKIMSPGVLVKSNTFINDRPAVTDSWSTWQTKITNLTTQGMSCAIAVYSGQVIIADNIMVGGGYFMPIDVTGSFLVTDIQIVNNIIQPAQKPNRGLILFYNPNLTGVLVSGNLFSGSDYGLDVRMKMEKAVITNNVFNAIANVGINFDSFGGYVSFLDINITNNVINATNYGIDLLQGDRYVVVGNNTTPAWAGIRHNAVITNIVKSGNYAVIGGGTYTLTSQPLPTAGAQYEGNLVRNRPTVSDPDDLYICVRNGSGGFVWKKVTLT